MENPMQRPLTRNSNLISNSFRTPGATRGWSRRFLTLRKYFRAMKYPQWDPPLPAGPATTAPTEKMPERSYARCTPKTKRNEPEKYICQPREKCSATDTERGDEELRRGCTSNRPPGRSACRRHGDEK